MTSFSEFGWSTRGYLLAVATSDFVLFYTSVKRPEIILKQYLCRNFESLLFSSLHALFFAPF